jgi:choline dehydrogenase
MKEEYMTAPITNEQNHDFIIVGSGAGGGPLAANLAEAGFSVLLIEAGGEETNDHYSVPAFHALSTEDPAFSWEFFVKHYSEDNHPERDEKYHPRTQDLPGSPGIFYPRASGIGGCTTHHAMITVYPHDSDWDDIAALVGDETWRADNMRKYFDRIEKGHYENGSIFLKLLHPIALLEELWHDISERENRDQEAQAPNRGWLPLTQADPELLFDDPQLKKVVFAAFKTARAHGLRPMLGLNPNHPLEAKKNLAGVNLMPISVFNGRRRGTRERVLDAMDALKKNPGQNGGSIDILTNTFVTQVEFAEDEPTRAIGVRCTPGKGLYGARHHGSAPGKPGAPVVYLARKEVILSGGAFNTPQLLMLSGIGPREELAKHHIPLRLESPGVGKNLQDRYEVGVVARSREPFKLLENASFKARAHQDDADPDPVYTLWREEGKGIYATNGSVIGIIKRSSTRSENDVPDLYIFGVPGYFRGYKIGYSRKATSEKNYFTWAVLKGHTENRSGRVKLKSDDPFEPPDIHFKYFEESNEPWERDLESVVDGVTFVQEINRHLEKNDVIEKQEVPKAGEDLATFVRGNAWGHHASCTCKIGGDGDMNAVLDTNFQVRGAKNLRVVDASVFPRIPGLFIVSAVYMISEKASDVIIRKHRTI